MRSAVAAADWPEIARLLREEWKLRRTNAPAIATPLIDRLIALARRNGALGAKVCGAGGGGCVLFMSEPDARARLEQKLAAAGAEILPFAVARHGRFASLAERGSSAISCAIKDPARLHERCPPTRSLGAGKPYPTPTLLPPLVRFMVAACWVVAVFWGSDFVFLFFPGHNLLPGLLFRLIACALTAAGFVFFLRVLDYNPHPLPVALGLPFDRVASRQWSTGFVLGALLITADVLFIVCFGSMHFQFRLTAPLLLRAAAVALLLFFGALMEELSFRGYPFQKLTEAFGALWAVILLSALFGAVHLSNPDRTAG